MKKFANSFKQKIITYISVIFVAALCIGIATLFGCGGKIKRLDTPTNLQLSEDEVLTWNEVEGTNEYMVKVTFGEIEKEYKSNGNSLDLFKIFNTSGTYEMQVMAYGDYETYSDSEWSDSIEYNLNAIRSIILTQKSDGTYYAKAASDSETVGKLIIPPTTSDGKIITGISSKGFMECNGITGVLISGNVREIAHSAFDSCVSLKKVELLEGVQTLCTGAFSWCANLKTINLPSSLSEINTAAFQGTGLEGELILPEGVDNMGDRAFGSNNITAVTIPSSAEKINPYAFENCPFLKSITVAENNPVYKSDGNCIINKADNSLLLGCPASIIPEYATAIGNNAFYNCKEIKTIDVPQGVTSIGRCAFWGCTGLTEINIPQSVTSIDENAFYGCTGITKINIPDNVTSINRGLFENCTGITEITLPTSVTAIGEGAFSGCTGLTEIIIPQNITSIGAGAFFGCTGLTEIIISKSVTSIGAAAFFGCTRITEIIIPKSVTSIGIPDFITPTFQIIHMQTFSNCTNLKKITVEDGNENYVSDGNCLIDKKDNTLIWGCENSVIPNHVTKIADGAFRGCKNLTEITIPEGVSEIGDYAFCDCKNLQSIIIPPSITVIGNCTFEDCTKLAGVRLPEGLTKIGSYAFANCTSLISIVIPKSVEYIKDGAFDSPTEVYTAFEEDPESWSKDNRFGEAWCNWMTVHRGCEYGYDGVYPYVINET